MDPAPKIAPVRTLLRADARRGSGGSGGPGALPTLYAATQDVPGTSDVCPPA